MSRTSLISSTLSSIVGASLLLLLSGCGGGDGDLPSAPASNGTAELVKAPDAPKILLVAGISATSLHVQWEPAAGQQTVEVHAATTPAFTPNASTLKARVTAGHKVDLTGLERNRRHFVRAVAESSALRSPASNEVTASTLDQDLALKSEVRVQRVSELGWMAASLSGNTLTLMQDPQYAAAAVSPAAGVILLGDVREAGATRTFFRRVVSVARGATQTVVVTEPVEIHEILSQGALQYNIAVPPETLPGRVSTADAARATSGEKRAQSVDPAWRCVVTVGGNVSAEGLMPEVSVQTSPPTINGSIGLDPATRTPFVQTTVTGRLAAAAQWNPRVTVPVGRNCERRLAVGKLPSFTFLLPAPLPPIPVTLGGNLVVKAEAEINLTGLPQFEVSGDANVDGTVGLRLDAASGPSFINTVTTSARLEPKIRVRTPGKMEADVSAVMMVEVTLGLEHRVLDALPLDLEFSSVIGSTGFESGFRMNHELGRPPAFLSEVAEAHLTAAKAEFYAEAFAELELSATLRRLLKLELLSPRVTFPLARDALYEAAPAVLQVAGEANGPKSVRASLAGGTRSTLDPGSVRWHFFPRELASWESQALGVDVLNLPAAVQGCLAASAADTFLGEGGRRFTSMERIGSNPRTTLDFESGIVVSPQLAGAAFSYAQDGYVVTPVTAPAPAQRFPLGTATPAIEAGAYFSGYRDYEFGFFTDSLSISRLDGRRLSVIEYRVKEFVKVTGYNEPPPLPDAKAEVAVLHSEPTRVAPLRTEASSRVQFLYRPLSLWRSANTTDKAYRVWDRVDNVVVEVEACDFAGN